MKLDSYKNDPQFLTERYRASIKNLNPLLESFDLKDPYYTYWSKEIHPLLIEVALDAKQIDALFKGIEQGASAAGNNRTMLGKAKDTAGAISDQVKDVWFNKLGGALQQSGPVKAFDEKYEEIKAKIAAENPKLAESLSKYKQFADNNPKLQKFLLMIAASIAGSLGLAVAGGAAAGIAATGLGVGAGVAIVNIADRLLKGEKASTAIGRGGTAGVVAGLSAAGVKAVSTMLNSVVDAIRPGEQYADVLLGNPPVEVRISAEDSEMLSKLGQEAMSSMEKQGGIGGLKDMLAGAGDSLPADTAEWTNWLKVTDEVAKKAMDPAYQEAIIKAAGDAIDTNIALSQLTANAAKASQTLAPIIGAVSGQAAGSAGEKKQPTPTEALQYNLKPLSEAQASLLFRRISETNRTMIAEGVIWEAGNEPEGQKPSFMQKVMGKAGEIGKNLTTKVTASKLMSAWKTAGSPTDSDGLADFLKQQGVNDQVIADTYAGMQLPPPGKGAGMAELANIKKEIEQLGPKTRQQLADFLSQRLGAA